MARPVTNNWTEAKVIKAIRQCAREINGDDERALSVHVYKKWSAAKSDVPKIHTVYELFESWPNACKAANFKLTNNPNTPVVSMEQVDRSMAAAIKRHRKLHGDAPMRERDYEAMIGKVRGVKVSLAVILRACGRWSEAGVKYGFPTARVKSLGERPMEEWAEEVAAICRRAGGPLSIRQFNEERPSGFPTSRRLATAFGGWDRILNAGGIIGTEIEAARHNDRLAVAARRSESRRELQMAA